MSARLSTLLDGIGDHEIAGDDGATEVTAVTQDSRAVVEGALYCCIRGQRVDGHDLAGQVVDAGARSLLVERWLDVSVPQVRVPSTRTAVGRVAAAFWGQPSKQLRVVGVTGTNGKTTATHLIAAGLGGAGWRTAVSGTLSGARTTPEAPVLQALLAGFVDEGYQAVAMEVSSIALDQHRVDGIDFEFGVWTNLTHDHLEYHHHVESYFAAKAALFDPERCRAAVINADDAYGRRLLETLRIPSVTYRLADATEVEISTRGSSFRWRGQQITIPLAGDHNISNALAAATVCAELGVPVQTVAEGISSVAPIPGRWEQIDAGQDFSVVVDYAHTPDGLEQVLRSARRAVGVARVLLVFGCGGDRDREKRPEMAAVATRLADVAVLTSDNPRSEDPAAIIAEARAGVERPEVLVVEPDREAAIFAALEQACPGDLVLIAGKGHETGQVIGDVTFPFDDREVARRVLGAR